MSILSQYIGDTDIAARFQVRQRRVVVLVKNGSSIRSIHNSKHVFFLESSYRKESDRILLAHTVIETESNFPRI